MILATSYFPRMSGSLILAHGYLGLSLFMPMLLANKCGGHLNGTDLEPITYVATTSGGSTMNGTTLSSQDTEWHRIHKKIQLLFDGFDQYISLFPNNKVL